jgi:hypothetical protein
MPLNVAELKGVSAELADKLHGQGFRDSDALLEALKSPAERRALAAKLQIGDNDILELANRADLARTRIAPYLASTVFFAVEALP